MKVKVIGIDLAKNVFQLHGIDQHGRTILQKRLSRGKFAEFMAQLPPCLVGMEACAGAHHWARKFTSFGKERRGYNKACVAVANKNARILWALMAHDTCYQANQ